MGKVNLKGNENMEQLVITPGGLRPKSKVHLIEEGFNVNLEDGILQKVDSNNNVIKEFGEIDSARPEQFISRNILRKSLRNMMSISTEFHPSPITDRWIIYSGWNNDSDKPISYFSTKWVVPPPPLTDNGQLIYIFNGIETRAFDLILQPVLQWGSSPAGGGSYWAVANWLVGSSESGVALHSKLVPVNTGDTLQGVMVLENQIRNKFSYLSSFNGKPQLDLHISGIDELTWANETLECYNFRQFSDYPNTLSTKMTDIEIRLGESQAQITWEAYNVVTDNGQHCSIISNASPDGVVELFYKQQLT